MHTDCSFVRGAMAINYNMTITLLVAYIDGWNSTITLVDLDLPKWPGRPLS